jgi:3'(2'), 5'-bisphosphate nucleotidase
VTGVLTREHADARDIAEAAGRLLVELRQRDIASERLKEEGDRRAHEFIVGELTRRYPYDAILSEEGADTADRLTADRVWIVDPLDGTREYAEVPRNDWAVHVALVLGGTLAAGAVALPARQITLSTAHPPSAPVPRTSSRPRLVVSRTRPTEHAEILARAVDGELVPMGSAGAKAMAVVLGEAELYAHSGGQYEWDSAAPVAVAAAAGMHVSRLDGSPLCYNQRDPWLPDLLICQPHLAAQVIAIAAR